MKTAKSKTTHTLTKPVKVHPENIYDRTFYLEIHLIPLRGEKIDAYDISTEAYECKLINLLLHFGKIIRQY